ncbi:MAG: hypothetical protein IKP88_11405 [Lachnospiraceae bacterium]|nr:hypothetical protein [Lachnospiraceae bacterium]
MDFKSDLLDVQANTGDLELCAELLKKIANWSVSESSDDRETVADLFYATLRAIQWAENECIIERFYKDTFAAFDNINLIAKYGKDSSSLVLIDFLNELYQRRDSLKSKIELQNDELLVLLSDLEPIKYIFKICDDDGNRYFPVNKLLGNIILDPSFINTKIEPYHINLIQLAVEMYRATCEEPTEQFEELINTCNLKFIKYLDGTCIRVDTTDMCNFRNNQVMVFYNVKSKKVLIRHEDEAYFLGATVEGKVEAEYNVHHMPIGHFVELNVEGTAIDYSDAIKESPKEFLRLLYEKNCKNVLIEKMIIRTPEGSFEPLNPFCSKDKWVVKGQINGRDGKVCLPSRFMDCIEEGRLQLFSEGNNRSVINRISLGLCMILLEKKRISIDYLFDDLNDNDWIQNSIIKNWASKSDSVSDAIEFVLAKYISDLDYCTKNENIMTIEFDKGRIRDSLPFSFDLKWVYDALDLPAEPSIFLGTITEEDEDLFYIDFSPIANKSLAKTNSKDITYISSTDVVLLEGTKFEDFYVDGESLYFVHKDEKWYSSSDLQNLYKLISLIEFSNSRMLNYELSTLVHENAFETIKSAMMLHQKELADISIKKLDVKSLIIIRLVNNLLLNGIDSSKWEYYYNLFAKQQILSFEGIEHDKYFSTHEKGVLVVPKDRVQEDAVLRKVYENYIRVNAERDVDWWFSGDELSENNDEFYINGSRIEKIRFLFDNTEHGTATIRAIATKLGKVDEWIRFEQKRKGQSEERLRQIIEKQSANQQFKCNGTLDNM